LQNFATLINQLDATTSTHQKVAHLNHYFNVEQNEKDKLWTIALFTNKKPSRGVSSALLRQWCAEVTGIPLWLLEENYHIVGDLAETIALLLPYNNTSIIKPLHQWISEIAALKGMDELDKKQYVLNTWSGLSKEETWIFNKIITGGFRLGIAKNLIIQALSLHLDIDKQEVAHHLMGDWHPEKVSWQTLFSGEKGVIADSKPYPFYLAYPVADDELSKLHSNEYLNQWSAEWKWDGIRGQLIKRGGQIFVWSRGEELMTDRFPELRETLASETDFVMDGEILGWKDGLPLNFQLLQQRIGRKNVTKKLMADIPIKFIAYDLLEYQREDLRTQSFERRRAQLEYLIDESQFQNILISERLDFGSYDALATLRSNAREVNAEGLMLKLKKGIYHTGRKTGEMWKWKLDPYTIDAVMLYAQRGHGRRANLYSDFTFALWAGDDLVPFTKAYSGLTDVEMKEVTAFVKKNTIATFGPVASVTPELVFEIAFEGIAISTRHKAGIALRFPRILRWRKDKTAKNANTLAEIKKLL